MTAPIRTTAIRAAVLTGAVALSVMGLPGIAHAAPGTLKIHSPGTPFDERQNEPQQACDFYLAAFDVKKNVGQTLNYSFTIQGNQAAGNNGDPIGNPGTITINKDSDPTDNKNTADDGRTDVLTKAVHGLPDGKYKVTLTDNADPDDPDKIKSKVLHINCPGGSNEEPPPGGGGDDDDEVGGGGRDDDEDEGAPGVGGVGTGGGGTA